MQRTRHYSFTSSFRDNSQHIHTVELLCWLVGSLDGRLLICAIKTGMPVLSGTFNIVPTSFHTDATAAMAISQQMSLTTQSCVDYENGDRLIRLFVNMCIAL